MAGWLHHRSADSVLVSLRLSRPNERLPEDCEIASEPALPHNLDTGYALIIDCVGPEGVSHLLHVHTRWLGHRGVPISSLDLLAGVHRADREWGHMWTVTVPGVVNATEQQWTTDVGETRHLAVIYELSDVVTRTGTGVIGVASPLPADTASILGQIQSFLSGADVSVASFKTDLSLQSLSNLKDCRIESVRVDVPHGYSTDQFTNPIDVNQLTMLNYLPYESGQISAVTALLDHGDSHIVVNLFEDNQFYVADTSPEVIGEVARRIAPLWEELQDADLP